MPSVDRRLIAIVAAGFLVVAAILIIVFVAIIPIPEFAALQPGQQSGYVAYQIGDDGHSEAIEIVNLETVTRVRADVDGDVQLGGWHTDGQLVVHDWRIGDHYLLVDPATGDNTGDIHPEQIERSRLDQAYDHHENGKVVIEHPDGQGSASFRAPESYDIHSAVGLKDNRIVFVDELGRVAVTDLGDDASPLMIASDAAEWSQVAARP